MAASMTSKTQGRAQPDAAPGRRVPVDHLLHAGDQLQQRKLRPAGSAAGRRIGPADRGRAAGLGRPTGLERGQRRPPADRRRGSAAAQGAPDDQASGRPGQAQPQGRRGRKLDATKGPADDDHLPCRPGRDLRLAHQPDQGLPVERVPEVRLEGDECASSSSRSVDHETVGGHRSGRTGLVGTQEHPEVRGARRSDHADAGHGVPAPDVLRAHVSSPRRRRGSSS